ncbi:diguanylate cyclase [Marinobacterium sp. D7]|uniref:diguanylate cyclase domain-containing protein n=1 Tax=Marinobacterium ramblicola TaxID=2849041 RepID=UPI001C2D9136|nr:diguanylate cyclase [Marinobacterium ramblicola]MBV1788732.1 diguanylate cyclase [Marinobacterium ramblicola]
MKHFVLQTKYWPLPLIIWSALVLASFSWNWDRLEHYTLDLAANRAQFVFKVVESVRMWNARHGGVYALVDDNTQPNPYLQIPERDLTSTDGVELTLLNPAYMTRQLADVVKEISDVRLHLTSLKPLNPGNAADPWETRALQAFEHGENTRLELIGEGEEQMVRFMAPLLVEPECMQCHAHQGYRIGDIRGGLSVSYSATPLLQNEQTSLHRLIWAHAGIWLLVALMLLFGLSQVRRHMLSLAEAKQQLDALVKQRTAELHTLTKAVEYSPVSTVITDRNGRIEYANPRFSEVTGYAVEEVMGRNPRLLQSGETPIEVYEQMWATITGGNIWKGELRNRKKNGEPYWELISISPIRDALGNVSHFVALKEDVTDDKARVARIHYQANYDDLTGLPNRKYFRELLYQQVRHATQGGHTFAVMFIDLDGFKSINDTFGHDAGDLLLQESARRITECVRKSDITARLGGDEFVLILQHTGCPLAIAQIAEKILQQLAQPFQLDRSEGRVTASIGIARYPRDSDNADDLLKRADSAMYQVKNAGRRNYCFYGDEEIASDNTQV